MNRFIIVITLCMMPLLQACDVRDPTKQPKTETRTMIIAGMPVHDRDFKMGSETILATNTADQVQPALTAE